MKNACICGHFFWRRVPESNRRRRICNPLHSHFANPPQPIPKTRRRKGKRGSCRFPFLDRKFGAGKESRTLDLNLGKVALYQLSYSRVGTNYSQKLPVCTSLRLVGFTATLRLTEQAIFAQHRLAFQVAIQVVWPATAKISSETGIKTTTKPFSPDLTHPARFCSPTTALTSS